MSNLYFTNDHEYVRLDGDIAYVGITNYAQKQLGDIVFVELPEAGLGVKQGDEACVVESVKAASEVYVPLSGEIIAGNSQLEERPELVNEDPEGEGWFLKMSITKEDELTKLMDQKAYQDYVKGLG